MPLSGPGRQTANCGHDVGRVCGSCTPLLRLWHGSRTAVVDQLLHRATSTWVQSAACCRLDQVILSIRSSLVYVQYAIEMAEFIELVFSTEATYVLQVLQGNSRASKTNVYTLQSCLKL